MMIKKKDQKKPWATRPSGMKRTSRNLPIKNIFWIFCEGTNTEPLYFKRFPVNAETKVEVIGLGQSKTALVEEVIKRKKQKQADKDRQIWCVFDFDTPQGKKSREKDDFNEAIRLAHGEGIKVAYSNDSFELWFILHYQYLDTKITREEYYKILEKHFGWNYKTEGKTKERSEGYYEELLGKQETAIKNAKKLEDFHSDKFQESDKIPMTTVYKLVLELNKNLKS